MFLYVKESDTWLLKHNKKQKQEKTSIDKEMENLKKVQAKVKEQGREG